MEFSRPEYWSGYLSPFPRDLPNPGIKPRSTTLQADSLPAEPLGKPRKLCHLCIKTILVYPFQSFFFLLYYKAREIGNHETPNSKKHE